MDSDTFTLRSVLSTVAGVAIVGSLLVIVFGLGGRSSTTPSPIELLGYEEPTWMVLALSTLVLVGGIGLTLALRQEQ